MEYDVVIAPSLMQVEAWRKSAAVKSRNGLFAQTVATFESWIADLWELHGDGRVIVSPTLREALMHSVAADFAQQRSGELVGVVPVAARCVAQAAGVAAFEAAIEAARSGRSVEGLSEQETAFLALIARYRDEASERGLVEFGEAAARLADDSHRVFARARQVLVEGVSSLTWIQEEFFSKCPQLTVSVRLADGMSGVRRAPEGVGVSFAFPSGRLAQPGLIADIATEQGEACSTVITCKDPLGLAGRIEARLVECGLGMRVQATKPFARTDFGRAFLACYRVANEDPWDPAVLADAAGSFFSGFAHADTVQIDQVLRGNRIAEKSQSVSHLRSESELFSKLFDLASEEQADVQPLLAAFEERVQAAVGQTGAWRAEQLAAIRRLRDVLDATRFAGAGLEACAGMLERFSVPVAVQLGKLGGEVLVTTQQIAASLPASSFDVALLADLTSEDYPIADKDDAASTLFAALGLRPAESALEHARCEFNAMLSLPSQRLVLIRPLGDDSADETYPSVMLEEFVDAYRDDPSDASEIDNAYRLPPVLQAGLVSRGEELLFANARSASGDAVQGQAVEIPRPFADDVPQALRGEVAPKRYDSQGQVVKGLCPSPSQIEAYLECPYQWFVNRRLHIEAIDEGFGPLEKGSFAHAALETFYRRFQGMGHDKVTEATLGEARELMRAVTRQLADEQYGRDPGSGRLVAANELERRDVAALCDQLLNYLDFEVKLLPTFHPVHLEYAIGVDRDARYAGHRLVGMVDRIDVDADGHAVIIDYKGSVNAEHEISGKVEGRCGKVQTRIYAQVVKRVLGLDVVGALYVSYGRNPSVAGAFDARVIEAAHLPGARIDKCSCGMLDAMPLDIPEDFSLASLAFGAMLDETEAIVGRALQEMEQGIVTPRPAHSKVCTYCPVLNCSKRGE